MEKNDLKPALVFEQFAKINEIPRPSKHEENMIEYLKEFGKSHNLETVVDETGNVLIRKAATPGYENADTIILQSHMDMVCDKLVDVEFDFHKDAIQTYVDGEWLKAKGTTLGADDGIGCAIELAILAADNIEHGPIECVFTRDEETGLSGAVGMKAGFMTGKMLINLDSEDEGQIFVSCAGGQTTKATFHFNREEAPAGYFFMEASLKGLNGGHSGDDINKKRANAIKVLARFLFLENEKQNGELRLVSFNSGKMHNAIPRDGKIVFAVKNEAKEQVRADWNIFASEVEDEFHVTEQSMLFNMGSADAAPVIEKAVADICVSMKAEDYLELQTKEAAGRCIRATDGDGESAETGDSRNAVICIAVESFLSLHPVIRKRLLYEEVKQLSPGQKDITYQHIQELLTLFTREGNRQICLPFGIRGRRQYEEVLLTVERTDRELLEKTEVAEKYQPTLQLPPGQTGTVECEVGTVEYCVCDLAAAHEKNQEVPTNQYTKWFDYDKIKKCPVIRTRKPGDYLTIADGRGGMIHKSLKSYLVDQKIPQAERDRLPILAEDDHVLWVMGYRISEYYKVTENTKRILKVQLIRKEFA